MRKSSKNIPKALKNWLQRAKESGRSLGKKKGSSTEGGKPSLGDRLPEKLRNLDFNFKDFNVKNVNEYSGWIVWGIIVLVVFALAQITTSIIGLYIRPEYPTITKRRNGTTGQNNVSAGDYRSIEDRNIFNVEGNIPEPFETGLLDCLSQAKPTSQQITLLGTIVMNDPKFSTALVQQSSGSEKIAVRKDEWFFDGRYLAMEVARKKLCFQVRATQELEFVEIPEDQGSLGVSSPSFSSTRSSGGIKVVSDNKFELKKNFLEQKLLNLNQILQTARAVPYIEPGTNQFAGFLIQTIDPDSPFAELGIKQGDVLKEVNSIKLDNAGKGLEAFRQLRSASEVKLVIVRSGRQQTLEYDVK